MTMMRTREMNLKKMKQRLRVSQKRAVLLLKCTRAPARSLLQRTRMTRRVSVKRTMTRTKAPCL